MTILLDFEEPIKALETKILELKTLDSGSNMNITSEITKLEAKCQAQLVSIYSNLTPWQKVQIARHPERPQFLDYIKELVTDFTPLSGDRVFGEDPAIIGGLGVFRGIPCMIMGHQKGTDMESRKHHSFGMAKPEGYRKAVRLMDLADRFSLPIITLVDTAGAYPGIEAEERGQAEAIARSIQKCLEVSVPFISVIIGEGGSGGAIALAVANKVFMLENSVYSVISPEGCASILWKSRNNAKEAATALKLSAQDLFDLKIIDAIIKEPLGGAHRSKISTISFVGDEIEKNLRTLMKQNGETLLKTRREKFYQMGSL